VGGFAAGMLGLSLVTLASSKNAYWFNFIFVLSFAVLIGVIWEFGEFFLDQAIILSDSLSDLAYDGLGAIISTYIYLKPKNHG
jgi:hypothetical protein